MRPFKIAKCHGRDVGCVGGRLSDVASQMSVLALSRGAEVCTCHRSPMQPCGTSAPPSHVSTLAACLRRARRNLRGPARRVSHSPPRRRAFELPSIESALSQYGTRRPSHRGTRARRISRPLPCPLPSSVAPLPRAHRQPRVWRVARRTRPFSLGGLTTHLRAALAAASCDSAVAQRLAHRHALPHRAQRLQRASRPQRAQPQRCAQRARQAAAGFGQSPTRADDQRARSRPACPPRRSILSVGVDPQGPRCRNVASAPSLSRLRMFCVSRAARCTAVAMLPSRTCTVVCICSAPRDRQAVSLLCACGHALVVVPVCALCSHSVRE